MNNPYIFTICSGKGGVGKSVTATNVAFQLSKLKQKTLIIDLDLNFPNIHLLLGIDPRNRLDDWMIYNAKINNVIEKYNDFLFIIAGNATTITDNIEKNQNIEENFSLIDLINDIIIENDFDFIIIDTSSGINNAILEATNISDRIAIVITDEPTSIIDAYGLIKTIKNWTNTQKINAIINNVIDYEDAEDTIIKLNKATKHFLDISIDIIGTILYEPNIRKSVINQKILSEYKEIEDYQKIAQKLMMFKDKS